MPWFSETDSRVYPHCFTRHLTDYTYYLKTKAHQKSSETIPVTDWSKNQWVKICSNTPDNCLTKERRGGKEGEKRKKKVTFIVCLILASNCGVGLHVMTKTCLILLLIQSIPRT